MKKWIETVLKEVVENMDADESIISKYFSQDYIQEVDGKRLDYQGFVRHMHVQKEILLSARVFVQHCIVEGNKLSTIHRVDAVKKDGKKLSVKVVAHFEVKDGKIIYCDELTRLLAGAEEDQDIASRA